MKQAVALVENNDKTIEKYTSKSFVSKEKSVESNFNETFITPLSNLKEVISHSAETLVATNGIAGPQIA